MTDTQVRCRSVALRAVANAVSRVEPMEESELLKALIEAAAQSLIGLSPDEAEASIIQAGRRARLGAKLIVAAETLNEVETFDEIIDRFCRANSIARDDLLSKRRKAGLFKLRVDLYELLVGATDQNGRKRWSMNEVAMRIGRDHSSISQALSARRAEETRAAA